ncbi:uncharacterized protein EV420DRAFT_1510619 [Desarmillaria tabescens]|uniref:Uncharacterized protein n=1 Tax=Armillaria tabescens TaxID=1929756 RepID=A0AA39NIL1_ARMTA|nr:uncharacterized protein EV420DRAFT_1510619 [Desarmillaria tabescens]KAK0466219.1 hypothetical protein EV420DRAFT_1510619 [Desarmillaria tabescens]
MDSHAALISANVLSYLDGKPLKEYKGSYELILVTNGKNDGATYFVYSGVLSWEIGMRD